MSEQNNSMDYGFENNSIGGSFPQHDKWVKETRKVIVGLIVEIGDRKSKFNSYPFTIVCLPSKADNIADIRILTVWAREETSLYRQLKGNRVGDMVRIEYGGKRKSKTSENMVDEYTVQTAKTPPPAHKTALQKFYDEFMVQWAKDHPIESGDNTAAPASGDQQSGGDGLDDIPF